MSIMGRKKMEELNKWDEACSGIGFAILKEVVRVGLL